MLSDEQMDRKIREHVKAHPVILPEDYQTMVQEQIRTCCEEDGLYGFWTENIGGIFAAYDMGNTEPVR